MADTDDGRVPAEARASLEMLAVQLEGVKAQILAIRRSEPHLRAYAILAIPLSPSRAVASYVGR